MAKENDYFLNTVENPSYSPGDFQAAGLDASNTTIRPMDSYKNLNAIQSNPEFQTDGKFDSTKFTNAYNNALMGYNQLSTAAQGQKLASSIKTSRFDIWSDPSEREQGAETTIRLQANPGHQITGFGTFGVTEAPKQSMRENAEASDVWDPNTHQFLPSPNSTPFQNFTTPLILDTWETDGQNIDPITGQKVEHSKGQPKLNPMGDYQYRRLYSGESIYGKQVLSGWDTLTVDGSTANKFDFFDSDDLNESAVKSLTKAAVKIIPAFLPHISPWYIGAQVALQFGDLASKVLKMVTNNSNNNALQFFETLDKTTSSDTSDYSQQHPFSFENNLNFAADTFNMLAQQRWIFKYVPAMIKGVSPELADAGKAGDAAREAESAKLLHDAPLLKSIDIGKYASPEELENAYKASDLLYTQQAVQKEIGATQKLGQGISRAYMAAAMSSSAYEEAKQQGLSDGQAALFTLGYAGAQYGLLGTGIGKFILPEKKLQTFRWQNLAKSIAGVTAKDTNASKLSTMQNIMRIGRDMFHADNADGSLKKIGIAALANSLSSGAEWVSFDVIGDLTKSLYNIVRPNNSPALDAFDNGNLGQLATRYAQSFLGGAVGGALSVGLPGMRQGRNAIMPKDRDSAWQETVSIVNNGQAEDFIKTIDRMPTADNNLSASQTQDTGKGQLPIDGSPTDNWDYQNKKNVINIVRYINDTLTTEGAKLSDDSVMNMIAGKDRTLKYMSLLNSSMSKSFLQDYNTLATRLVADRAAIDKLTVSPTDQAMPKLSESDEHKLSDLKSQLEKDRIELTSYKDGTKFKEFVPIATYELNDNISSAYTDPNFVDYVQRMDGRLFDDVPDPTKNYYKQKWNDFKSLNKADQIKLSYMFFKKMNEGLSANLQSFADDYVAQAKSNMAKSLTGAELVDKGLSVNIQDPEQKIIYAAHYQSPDEQDQYTQGNKLTSIFNAVLQASDDPGKEAIDEIGDTINKSRSISGKVKSVIGKILDSSDNVMDAWKKIESLPISGKDVSDLEKQTTDTTGLKTAVPDITSLYKKTQNEKGEDVGYDNIDVYSKFSAIHEAFIREALRNDRVADSINNSLSKLSYLDNETKDYLSSNTGLFSKAGYNGQEQEEALEDGVSYDKIKKDMKTANRYKETVNAIRYSPVEKLMDSFMVSAGGKSGSITGLIDNLRSSFGMAVSKGTERQFSYDIDQQKQVESAIRICDFLQAHIAAARNDNASIGNYGYNSMVNKLTGSKLAEIDNNTAQVLAQDIEKTRTRLVYYEDIFRTNSQQKLSEQPKIRARIAYAKIQKTKETFTSDFASWKGYDKFKTILDTAPDDVPDYDSLNGDQRKTLFRKSVDVENAVHDFITSNYDKIMDGTFADYLISHKFNLLESHDTSINGDMKRMDDRSLLSWMASNTAVKADDFYAEYRDTLGQMGDYAPVPGQEETVRMAYSFRLNRKVFDDFSKIYNKVVQSNLDSLSMTDLVALSKKTLMNGAKNSGLDNDYSITMPHSIFTEGGPGTGKSTAFYSVTLGMLAKYHPEAVSKIWIVHISHDKAQKLIDDISSVTKIPKDHFVPLSQEEYLKTLNPEYKTHDYSEDGIIITDPKDVSMDNSTQLYHYSNEKVNASISKPSIAIIDEGTRLSQQDCLLSEKFCKKYNVCQFITGDFDQMGAVGTFKSDKGRTIQVGMSRNNFLGGHRLGTSMRTENMIKDSNISNLRNKKDDAVRDLIGNIGSVQDAHKAVFQYYENGDSNNGDTGLFGDKIDTFGDSFKQTVVLMLKTLKDNEKIGFIYQRKHTPLYDWLQSLMTSKDYKDKISFVEGSSSQGDEAQYYIAEMLDDTKPEKGNPMSWAKNKLNTFYTAVSRARQGTLILSNGASDELATSTKADSPMKSPLSRQAIIKSIKDTKDMFSSVIKEKAGNTKLVEETDNTGTKTIKETKDTDNDVDKGESKVPGVTDNIKEGNVRWVDIDNDNDEKEFPSLVYSMPVNETGATDNGDGTYSLGYRNKGRIDGVNGLSLITKKNGQSVVQTDGNGNIQDMDRMVTILNNIKSAGLYMHDKDSMAAYIKKQLGTDASIGIDFAWKKSVLQTPDETIDMGKNGIGRNRFVKWAKEYIYGAFMGKNSNFKTNHAGQDKSIVMIVYKQEADKNGKLSRTNVLEVPMFIFTSPFSMMKTKGFEDISDQFDKYAGSHDSLGKLYDYLQTDEGKKLKNSDKMSGLIRLYTTKTSDGNMIHYFDDKFVPSEYARSITGPYIICGNAKGHDYIYSGDYQSSGEWVDLDKINKEAMDISDNMYIASNDVYDSTGNLLVGAGDSFVITSAFKNSPVAGKSKDQGMLEEWLKQDGKGGPYSCLLISMPKVSVSDYFSNFAKLYHRAKEGAGVSIDSNMGNELSIFRMLSEMTKPGSAFGDIMNKRIDLLNGKTDADGESNRNYDDMDKRWSVLKNIVQELQGRLDKNETVPSELVSTINDPIEKHFLDMSSGSTRLASLMHSRGENTSLKDYFQLEFYNMVLRFGDEGVKSVEWDGDKPVFDDDIKGNINAIESDLKKKSPNFDGIFVRASINGEPEDINGNRFMRIRQRMIDRKPTYSILNNDGDDYGKAQTNGKIDSTAMVFDINPMIHEIVDGISNEEKNKADIIRYTKNGWTPPDTKKISLYEKLNGNISKKQLMSIQNTDEYKKAIKDNPDIESQISDISSFKKVLADMGIPVVPKGKGYVAGHPKENMKVIQANSSTFVLDNKKWYTLSADKSGINENPVTLQEVRAYYDSMGNDIKSYIESKIGEDASDQILSGKADLSKAVTENLQFAYLNDMYNQAKEPHKIPDKITVPSLDELLMMKFPKDVFNDDKELSDSINQSIDSVASIYRSIGQSPEPGTVMADFSEDIADGDDAVRSFFDSGTIGLDNKSLFLKTIENSIINKVNDKDNVDEDQSSCILAQIKFL